MGRAVGKATSGISRLRTRAGDKGWKIRRETIFGGQRRGSANPSQQYSYMVYDSIGTMSPGVYQASSLSEANAIVRRIPVVKHSDASARRKR